MIGFWLLLMLVGYSIHGWVNDSPITTNQIILVLIWDALAIFMVIADFRGLQNSLTAWRQK
jgi:hypothetical protein